MTLVPFRLLATWSQARLATGAGGLLEQRLLYGALRLEPEEIRHQGAAQLLGRVLEAEAVEALAEYVKYHLRERNHQGKGNVLLFPPPSLEGANGGPIQCRERLGGLLKCYEREAA